MPPDLREIFDKAAASPSGPSRVQEAIQRAGILRRRRRAAAVLLSGVAVAAGIGSLTLLPGLSEDHVTSEEPRGCRAADETEIHRGAYGRIESDRLTPVVLLGEGEQNGSRWFLCAYMSSMQKNAKPAYESLCLEFRFGPGPGAGYTCSNLGSEAPGGSDYFYRAAGPPNTEEGFPFFGAVGAVSRLVRTVEIRPHTGEVVKATLLASPPELGVDYSFFVGFGPPNVDTTVRVLGEGGELLGKETFDAPSVISATRSGDGEGTVRAYSTEMLRAWRSGLAPHKPTKLWLDCGSDCTGSVEDDASVTFVAVPTEGSHFAGWRGACSGPARSCRVRIEGTTEVVAIFDGSPPSQTADGKVGEPNEDPIVSIVPEQGRVGDEVELTIHHAPGSYGLHWVVERLEGSSWQFFGNLVVGPGKPWENEKFYLPPNVRGGYNDIGFDIPASMELEIPELEPGKYRLIQDFIRSGRGSVEQRTETHAAEFEVIE